MKQRPPAMDLSGPKASAESLTPRRAILAEDDAVDFQFGLFSSAAAPAPEFSFSGLVPSPSRSRPPPGGTRDSDCGSELDGPTFSSGSPGSDLSPLRLLFPSRCLISFLNLESESRRSSMVGVESALIMVRMSDDLPRGPSPFLSHAGA